MTSPDAARKAALEALLTRRALNHLEAHPVTPTFDLAHLCEIHRRIFAAMPKYGLEGFSPGELRPAVRGGDWTKHRTLETATAQTFIVYSAMDEAALAQLQETLVGVQPAGLGQLDKAKFVERLATLYAWLDYIHPFREGNSRTLRTYTRQLAAHSGYAIHWERLNRSALTRDLLYVARDAAVGQIALGHAQPASQRELRFSLDQFANNPSLARLLTDIVEPLREHRREQGQSRDR